MSTVSAACKPHSSLLLFVTPTLDDAYLLLMRCLNAQKKTAELLTIASDVLEQLGVEATWLREESVVVVEKDRFRSKIKRLVIGVSLINWSKYFCA